MDDTDALPTQAEAQVDGVQQETTGQLRCLLGRQWRHQARFGSARLGRLANHDQRATHLGSERSTARGDRTLRIVHRPAACTAALGDNQLMSDRSPHSELARRLEQQLAESGLQVFVEASEGSLILTGVVETEEAREAATDIATAVAPDARIDNQIDVESILPTDIDDFASAAPSAEVAGDVEE